MRLLHTVPMSNHILDISHQTYTKLLRFGKAIARITYLK